MTRERGAARAERRVLVMGDGAVAEAVAGRLAWGGCDVARAADVPGGARALQGPHDAVVLLDGGALGAVALRRLDLAAWAPIGMGALGPSGVLLLVGADGRLREPASGPGPVALVDALVEPAAARDRRVGAVLLRGVRGERGAAPRDPASTVGASAAEAIEYLSSGRAAAMTGAVLHAPVTEPAIARRSAADDRAAVPAPLRGATSEPVGGMPGAVAAGRGR